MAFLEIFLKKCSQIILQSMETVVLHCMKNLISETIAFHSVLTSYDTIEVDITVVFNLALLNEGNG